MSREAADSLPVIRGHRNLLRYELTARLLSHARDARDKREAAIAGRLAKSLDVTAEDVRREQIGHELAGLNSHIEEQEKRVMGGLLLEEILKDEEYNRDSLGDLVPSLPKRELRDLLQAEPQDHPMAPIEITVDEAGSSSSSAQPKEEAPMSIMSTGDSNVEKAAKMEAHVIQRVAELRRQGLWTQSRLPLCVEPPRNKTHWDYLLEEVKWMANDFRAERNWKRKMAKTICAEISKNRRHQELEVERAEQRVLKDGRKICASIARMVKDFWLSVDKVVEYRAQEILEGKKRKALDQHLAFIVGQADKLSSMVQEGLAQEKTQSKTPSVSSKQDVDDREFLMNEDDEDESDNESTLSKEEGEEKEVDYKDELAELNDAAGENIDDLLAGLPPEYLASLGLSKELLKTKAAERPQSTMSVKTEDSVASSSAADSESQIKEEEKPEVELNGEGNGDGRGVFKDVDYAKLNSANADEREQELAHIAEQALQFQPKGFTLETTQVKTQVPFLVRGQLREYQMVGLDWLVTLYEKNLNGILADEMGLGKTIQTISLLAHLACAESIWGPHLIVVPTSVILNWEMELKKWCPAFKILTYFGTVKERAEKRKGWMKANAFHIVITSYKTITTDIRSFKMRSWQYMILDEAQNIKNWKSQRWQALLNIRARRRLLLTGTPLQNSLMELWSLMHFLMPAIFASHDDFKDWFSNPLTGMMEGSVEYNAPLVQRLHKILRPFILRRLKSEVEKQLPEKTETVIKCQLSKRQRYLYDDFMSRRSTKENLKTGNMFSVLNIVMQLRKCCNHPNLFEPRPVLSPFVLEPLQKALPAMVFDIVGENARQEDLNSIPDCLDIRNRMSGWSVSTAAKKPPTIEELRRCEAYRVVPKIPGFRLAVPALSREDAISTATSPAVLLVAGGGGEAEPTIPEPSSASLPSSSAAEVDATVKWILAGGQAPQQQQQQQVPQRQIVTMSSRPGMKRTQNIHPAFKTHTQLSTPSTSSGKQLAVLTDLKGFNHMMANGGARESIANFDYQFSPPMKRKKFQDVPLVTGPYAAYVPQDFREHLAEERVRRLELARDRFETHPGRLYPNELVYLLTRHEGGEQLEEMKRLEKVQRLVEDHTYSLLNKFPLYVEPVQVDSPTIVPLSKGRCYLASQHEKRLAVAARTQLEDAPPTLDAKLLSSRLQFPELRLIEYDCGKLQTLALLLRNLYLYKHRCLIFTQMSRMLDILQAFLSHHGYQYFRLDGTTGIEQRQAMMERFNADSRIFCFILSTRSGGVGVNLTGADTVIFYDSDWNPTMDAQAQDRCHRIGQTRNVTIYRLISERTIEENILKKAMQKRRLGEMAIDDAGFTPEFFKQSDNIRDLFAGDVEPGAEIHAEEEPAHDQKELETAMASLEDEQDAAATKMATAEARADRAEFDDAKREATASLLTGGDEAQDDKYMELINQLKPIERYAVQLLEAEYKPEFEEECKEAEAVIEQKKEDWVRTHEQPADELVLNEDDFYACGSILDEILASGNIFDDLPTWCPPTPPLSPGQRAALAAAGGGALPDDGDDIYYDDCLDLLYDPDFMGESRLPHVIHDLHRPLMRTPSPVKKPAAAQSPVLANSSKNKTVMDLLNAASAYSSTAASPMSTYDPGYYQDFGYQQQQQPDYGASQGLDAFGQPVKKEKRPGKEQSSRPNREAPRPITPPSPYCEQEDYEGPEWNIIEDMAIVEAIEFEETMCHLAGRCSSALQYNWKYVADYVNMRTAPTGHYRSPRQCCIRYQVVVRPREAGHLHTLDPLTKKPRKVPVTQTELSHLKKGRSSTRAQYEHDYPIIMETTLTNKSKLIKALALKTRKAPRSYLDTMPAVIETKLPENFEAKLLDLKLASNLRTVLPEDMVRKQEEVHFLAVGTQTQTQQQGVVEPLQEQEVRKELPPSIGIRRSAIPATGMIESKAPYIIEMPAIQTRPAPPPPPPRPGPSLHSVGIPQLLPADHPVSHVQTISTAGMTRRMGSTMGHMNSSGYVVVQNDHPNALRVQRAEQIGPSAAPMFRGISTTQVRRTPPASAGSLGGGGGVLPRQVNYVSSAAASQGGGGYITTQQGGATMYSGPSQLVQGGRTVAPASRVVSRPGAQQSNPRFYLNNERGYVMQHPPHHVRVVSGGGVQRVQPTTVTAKRVGQPKGPGTVATVVVPAGARTAGPPQQFRTIRTVQRTAPGPSQGTRVMNVVMGSSQLRTTSGHLIGQSGMTRQLLTAQRTIPSSRTGSPQTIAQVVIAPPSSMQQQPRGGGGGGGEHPPILTAQQMDQQQQPPGPAASEAGSSTPSSQIE